VTRTAAHDRLGRLLAIVPWVAARDGPEIAEVCRRFGITQRELLADLDLLFVCGVYPFTPDVLIDVDIADGRVWIRFADYFRRPLRLTPPEGLALIGAGAALLGVPGADPDGALARALSNGSSRPPGIAIASSSTITPSVGTNGAPGSWSRGGSSTLRASGIWPAIASRPAASGCFASTGSAGSWCWTSTFPRLRRPRLLPSFMAVPMMK